MVFSLNDKHIIVNFHYIENPKEDFKGIHPCSVKVFEEKIKFLSNNYRITDIPEIFQASKNESSEKLCALTFDDGLKDQYENALPVLKRYKAQAIFFPITGTLNGYLPSTHKIHILLSKFTAEKLIDECNIFFKKYYPETKDKYIIPKNKRITEKRKLRDDILTANFKETINIVPNNIKKRLLSWLFDGLRLNEKTICKELFMNEEEIKTLVADGFSVGGHTHQHLSLDTQTKDVIKNEIQTCKKILSKITGQEPKIFSYPHGSTNQEVMDTLEEENFSYALTIERNAVKLNKNPLLLPRYDVNDIV